MSTFIWGKIKLNKLIIMDNYQRKNILVFFTSEKNDLFRSDLEENEIYFNIACGYDKMMTLPSYKTNYLNCNEYYFSLNSFKKTDDLKPYIRLEVKEIIRENELRNDFEEPKLDEMPSQKEPEEKHKVTKKRKAIIEKFAKNVLKYSAIGAENIKYGFIDVAKEISHIGSKLKNKLIGKNTVDVPELDETMDKNAVKGNKTKLLSFLRLRKNKKTVEEKTPVEPEVVNKPKEEKKPDEYEELDDDIKKSISDALADIGNSNNNNQAKLEEVTDYNEYATIDDLLNSQGGR